MAMVEDHGRKRHMKTGFSCHVCLLRPKSRGSVALRSADPHAAPLIDPNANREHFEEGVDIVFKAFNEERFSHRGKYYTIPPEVPYRGYTLKEITLVPRPMRLPVECWQPIQSGSDRAFDFMAKHGISGVIGGGSAEGGAVERHMLGFQAAYARRGIKLEMGEKLSLGYQFYIAESREAAMKDRNLNFVGMGVLLNVSQHASSRS